MLTGENGILKMAGKAKEETEIANEKEHIQLAYIECQTFNLNTEIKVEELLEKLNNNKITTESVYGDSKTGFAIILKNKNIYEIDASGNIEYKGAKIELSNAEPKMMARDDSYAFWQSEYSTKITKIETKPYITKLDSVIEEWAISSDFDQATGERKKSVMAYLVDDGNNEYELYIMSNGKIILNSYAYRLFSDFLNLKTINVSNFDAKDVWNMNFMFRNCANLEEVILDLNSSNLTNTQYMFAGCDKLKKIDLSKFITDNVSNMCGMFMYCKNLTYIDLSNLNTENVTNMSQMFDHCENIKNINVGNINTNKVVNMHYMFNCCYNLEKIELGSLTTDSLTSMQYMFASCTSLKKLDISKFNTQNVTDMSYMFRYCGNLTSVSIGPNWSKENANTEGMFEGCNIII